MDFEHDNPYQSPTVEMAELVQPDLFVFNNSRLTFGECWSVASNPLEFMLAVMLRLVRIRLPPMHALGHQLYLVPAEQLPEDARHRFQKLGNEAMECGLRYSFTYALPIVGNSECFAAVMRSNDGRLGMWMAYGRMATGATSKVTVKYNIGSLLQDGTFLVTSGSKPDLQLPAHMQVERLIGKPVRRLLERHYERLAESRVDVVPWTTDAQCQEFISQHERRCMEFNIARGVFCPATQVELKHLYEAGQKVLPPPTLPAIGYLRSVFYLMIVAGLSLPWLVDRVANLGWAGRNDSAWGVLALLLIMGGFAGAIGVGIFQFVYRRAHSK